MAEKQKSSSAGVTGSNTPLGTAPAGTQPVTLETLAQLFGSMAGNQRALREPLATGIDQAIALAEALSKYQKLGKAIEPKLDEDGGNFPDWQAAISHTVATVWEISDYYASVKPDNNGDRRKLTGILVEQSVHLTLVLSVQGKHGRVAFQILRARFEAVSWTYVLSKWMKATEAVNPTGQLNATYLEIKTCLDEIERRTGGFHKDLVLAMIFHQQCQASYQEIANALDARLAVDGNTKITLKSVLELASRFESGAQATGSVFAYCLQIRGGHHQAAGTSAQPNQPNPQGGGGKRTGDPNLAMWRHDAWARRVLNNKHPCRYCYEWGHWVADCPLYKARKPPLGDPRLANPNFKLRKSAVCHLALL
jgi:hypothetical protein